MGSNHREWVNFNFAEVFKMLNIGFIGFGEAASLISLGLSENKEVRIKAYDVLINDNEKRPLLLEKASHCNVSLSDSMADLAGNSEIILSTVTSSVAIKVADEISPFLNNKHIFVDLNAITPAVAQKVAAIVEKTGAAFIDGAMMGALRSHKHKVPILLSGKDIDVLVDKIAPLGFNTQYVGTQPGAASGNKLARSVFTKGLAALLIETLTCAKKLGYYDVVLDSIFNSLKAEPSKLVNGLITGTMIHSHRRLGELSGAKEMLREAGMDSKMIEATINIFLEVDGFDLNQKGVPVETESAVEMLSSYLNP
jgi:3-hydroxyisobutyrate dehydrogenase-like beta-hydroxyacid dehydrogenase